MGSATEPAAPAKIDASKEKTSSKNMPALLLTLGGAPTEWHVIPNVGYVHPTIPSPVGGEREPSLEKAKELASAEGCAVELVYVSKAQAEKCREAVTDARSEGVTGARETRAAGKQEGKEVPASDAESVANEAAAAAGQE